ncbi:DUF4249 domain-containing protein [Niabella soli]|uniref:DUF4249 domain-containing protein n=1 Tax=Niabella soli DSM 19437 TaxID=929713 RepID=W0F4T4_9BACT|nr:DUF4249 domain-containing protein [Niabella soli]AHF18090.1 hypothetical protein NIASO_20330 [Niabella soli DSM 19437]
MKRFKRNLLLLIVLGAMSAGCQKVIHLSIEGVAKKYVIEATVADNTDFYNVIISQTLNIADSNLFRGVPNALVTISEDGKTPVPLADKGNGIYHANVSGRPGHTYNLVVKVDGQVFTASSTMPVKVPLDSVYINERPFLGRMQKIAAVAFTDPPGEGNAYRFTQYVNDRKEITIFVTNDKLFDGRSVSYELLVFSSDEESDLKTGDHLKVEMRCISMDNYMYWYSLSQSALGQNQSASPGNPVTNITGGALGHFSANTYATKTIIVR